MATTKLYKWLLTVIMIIAAFASYAQPSAQDILNKVLIKERTPGPVVERDGTTRYPDGTIVYPDGTVRYPNGRIERNDRYPDFERRDERRSCCNGCGLPPGQAKKRYGGQAKDYAKGRKHCKKDHDDDDDWDDDRRVRRYPQQYPQYPQNPRNGQKYPSGKNRQL